MTAERGDAPTTMCDRCSWVIFCEDAYNGPADSEWDGTVLCEKCEHEVREEMRDEGR